VSENKQQNTEEINFPRGGGGGGKSRPRALTQHKPKPKKDKDSLFDVPETSDTTKEKSKKKKKKIKTKKTRQRVEEQQDTDETNPIVLKMHQIPRRVELLQRNVCLLVSFRSHFILCKNSTQIHTQTNKQTNTDIHIILSIRHFRRGCFCWVQSKKSMN
jgi:hypothetical protein